MDKLLTNSKIFEEDIFNLCMNSIPKLWVNRLNRYQGTRLFPGQTPFYYGVCFFLGQFYWKIIHRGDHIKIDKIIDESW